MVSFILPFVQRCLSGMQSMYGYEKSKKGFIILSLVMLFYPMITFKFHWLFFLYFIVNAFIVYMKTSSFELTSGLNEFKKYHDIHLWENLITGGYMVYMILSGFNVLLLICSVYPALIIHKGLINIGSGLSFFATATDDPTGKTYGFKLFNLKIKRSSNFIRLIFASVSIIAALLILHYRLFLMITI
jgi:hypothetical protein